MRYGAWFNERPAYQEYKLPVFFFIAPTKFLDKIPYSYTNLWHNSLRLTAKLDMRPMLLTLGSMHSEKEYDWSVETYLEQHGVNLLTEIASPQRTCTDCNILPWFCACLKMNPLERPVFDRTDKDFAGKQDPVFNVLSLQIDKVMEYILEDMNSQIYASPVGTMGRSCLRLTLNRINSIEALSVTAMIEQL